MSVFHTAGWHQAYYADLISFKRQDERQVIHCMSNILCNVEMIHVGKLITDRCFVPPMTSMMTSKGCSLYFSEKSSSL